jgi:hypothetical protein
MARILPPLFDAQVRHVSGLLFFFESDFDTAWWENMEPENLVEAVAKWLRGKYQARPALMTKELLRVAHAESTAPVKTVGQRTLERAKAMAWPS